MKVEFLATGPEQECGIATYTTTLETALDVAHARTPLKLRTLDVPHYVLAAVRAGLTDADVVHVQHEYGIYGPMSLASWFLFPVLWLLTRLRDRPLVITFHSAWHEGTVEPPLLGLKLAYLRANNLLLAAVADHAVFLSEETREEFEESADLDSVEVMEHGVPTDVRPMPAEEAKRLLGVPTDRPLVAEPGFVRPQKGYHRFLDIAERVPEATFLIAGGTHGDAYTEYLDELRERAGDSVEITGVLDDDRFHALFNALDAALLPYDTVTQSGVLNWCLAYDVPVVGTDTEQFAALAAEHGFPAVFPADDPEAGAAAVREALAEPDALREAMARYREEHDMGAVASRHEALYRRLVGRNVDA